MVIKGSFDPNIEWLIPEGEVPFVKNDLLARRYRTYCTAQEFKEVVSIHQGWRQHFATVQAENMFIQMLEGLHESEAELPVNAKDKKLHQVYKGLSKDVVKEAFGWNDNFIRS